MGYSLDKYIVKLDIRLAPGLYVYTKMSATGKSCLSYYLDKYREHAEPVCSYSYTDFKRGTDLEQLISNIQPKVLHIDRYDMFFGEYLDTLQRAAATCIVLIDTKRELPVPFTAVCSILMRKGSITVL